MQIAPPVVDFIVLCGFLGSGKTTLLVDLLSQQSLNDTAVIVNEAGEIGLDGALIAEAGDASTTMLLSNGCVCCSLRSSLVITVAELLDAPRALGVPPLRRIILETSGVSRPGPILASLADPGLAARNLRVCVVSTYDASQDDLHEENFEEAAAQLTAAQRIVLTKSDLVGDAELSRAEQRAEAINPLARIGCTRDRTLLLREAFSAQKSSHNPERSDLLEMTVRALSHVRSEAAHARIHVMRATLIEPIEWEDFSVWLDDLAGACGENLLRVKALVHVQDCEDPVLVQSVGTTYGMPRRMPQHRSSPNIIVVITRDLNAEDLAEQLPHPYVKLQSLIAPSERKFGVSGSSRFYTQRSTHAKS